MAWEFVFKKENPPGVNVSRARRIINYLYLSERADGKTGRVQNLGVELKLREVSICAVNLESDSEVCIVPLIKVFRLIPPLSAF